MIRRFLTIALATLSVMLAIAPPAAAEMTTSRTICWAEPFVTSTGCATGRFRDRLVGCEDIGATYWVCTVIYYQDLAVTGVLTCGEMENSETGSSGTCAVAGAAAIPTKADNVPYSVYPGGKSIRVGLCVSVSVQGLQEITDCWYHMVYLPGPPAPANLPPACDIVCQGEYMTYVVDYLPNSGEVADFAIGTAQSHVPW